MTAIILAGGKCRRFNHSPKAFLNINGSLIIERMLKVLKGEFNEIIVVTNTLSTYEYLGVPLVKDLIEGLGPLGGIYSGLVNSSSNYNFVFACDMPFINPDLIRHMINITQGYDIIIPKLNGLFEPLHAVYSKNCIGPIERQLKRGNLKIIDFFKEVKVKEVAEIEIGQFLPERAFVNINTPTDYKKFSAEEKIYAQK